MWRRLLADKNWRAIATGPLAFAALVALVACAAPPAAAPAPPDAGALRGVLRLVPHPGVTPLRRTDGAYADRRFRDVEPVDYDRPGFAVVYVDGLASPGGAVRLALKGARTGARFVPAHAAVGESGRIVLANDDEAPHAFSCPAARFLRRLAPGEEAEVPAAPAGDALAIFAMDVPGAQAEVFVSPGPFAVVGPSGGFEIAGLPPGRRVLRAWHPRFPPATREVDLPPGATVHADIEIGVGRSP